jgi:glycosyltransferase involved in cell wall biosynthesis
MSNFGAEQMKGHNVEPVATIYHAVDLDVMKPMDKEECRDVLGVGHDEYLVGMVMANKGDRKQFPLQLQAVKNWADKNPDIPVKVYIHTEPTAVMGGWDMRELVKTIGLSGRVYSTNQYDTSVVPASPQLMATIYNSMDVLMNCSAGEGFGIPIVEAQACGIPVITHGVTAMPEITHYGYTVESSAPLLGGHFGWQAVPSVEDMTYRLDCVYRFAAKNWSLAGRQWVANHCGLEVVGAQWAELLNGIEASL